MSMKRNRLEKIARVLKLELRAELDECLTHPPRQRELNHSGQETLSSDMKRMH